MMSAKPSQIKIPAWNREVGKKCHPRSGNYWSFIAFGEGNLVFFKSMVGRLTILSKADPALNNIYTTHTGVNRLIE